MVCVYSGGYYLTKLKFTFLTTYAYEYNPNLLYIAQIMYVLHTEGGRR